MEQLTLDFNSTLTAEQYKDGLPKRPNGRGIEWNMESFSVWTNLKYPHITLAPGQVWTGVSSKYRFICEKHGEYEARAAHVLIDCSQCQCKGCEAESRASSAGFWRATRGTKDEKDLAAKLKLEGIGVTEISRRLGRSQATISKWLDPKQVERQRQLDHVRYRDPEVRERTSATKRRYRQFEHSKMDQAKRQHKRRGIEYHCIDVVFLPDHPEADSQGFVSYNIWDLVKVDTNAQEMMSFAGANEDVAKRKQQQIGLTKISGETYSLEHLVPLSQGGVHCPENFANRALTLNLQKGAKRLPEDDALFVKRLFN